MGSGFAFQQPAHPWQRTRRGRWSGLIGENRRRRGWRHRGRRILPHHRSCAHRRCKHRLHKLPPPHIRSFENKKLGSIDSDGRKPRRFTTNKDSEIVRLCNAAAYYAGRNDQLQRDRSVCALAFTLSSRDRCSHRRSSPAMSAISTRSNAENTTPGRVLRIQIDQRAEPCAMAGTSIAPIP